MRVVDTHTIMIAGIWIGWAYWIARGFQSKWQSLKSQNEVQAQMSRTDLQATIELASQTALFLTIPLYVLFSFNEQFGLEEHVTSLIALTSFTSGLRFAWKKWG